jgi:tetratricopeptide (TPR) repeat protein
MNKIKNKQQKKQNEKQIINYRAQSDILLLEALKLHKENELNNAKKLYEEILCIEPNNFDAMHLLGVIEHQNKNHLSAIKLIKAAIEINPNYADAHNNLGNAQKEEKYFNDAISSFEKAINLNSQHADAYNNRGNVLKELLENSLALKSYDAAIRIKQNFSEAHFNRANLLHDNGLFIDAITSFDKAIEYKHNYFEAYNNRGSSLHALRQFEDAISSYDKAISINENYAEAYNNRGYAKHLLEKYDNAIIDFNIAAKLKPDLVEAYYNMANTFTKLRRIDLSIKYYNKSIALNPRYANAYHNRGMLLNNLGYDFAGLEDCGTAKIYYTDLIFKNPNNQKNLLSLGYVNKKLGDDFEAEINFKKIMEINPLDLRSRESLSRIQLCRGSFKEGWINYTSRETSPQDRTQLPDISSLKPSSKILFLREQGLGDELFFLRFIETFKKNNKNIFYDGSIRLKPLIENESLFIDWIDSRATIMPKDYDAQIAIGNLPAILDMASKSEIPPPIKLKVNPRSLQEIKNKLEKVKDDKLIGVTWRGGTQFADTSLFKQAPLDQLGKVLKGSLGAIIVLQRNPNPGELEQLSYYAGREIYDFSETNENLESMLALLSILNDYIGVSNTNMHLMAGLSKSAKVLIPFPSEFRWMDKGLSPWFPNFSLYRQDNLGSWENAFMKLKNELR